MSCYIGKQNGVAVTTGFYSRSPSLITNASVIQALHLVPIIGLESDTYSISIDSVTNLFVSPFKRNPC